MGFLLYLRLKIKIKMAKALYPDNFLGIREKDLCSYEASRIVIQSLPYEHTSSYLSGSSAGPAAILEASRYVEFYDEELDREIYRETGIATLPAVDFRDNTDSRLEEQTSELKTLKRNSD